MQASNAQLIAHLTHSPRDTKALETTYYAHVMFTNKNIGKKKSGLQCSMAHNSTALEENTAGKHQSTHMMAGLKRAERSLP